MSLTQLHRCLEFSNSSDCTMKKLFEVTTHSDEIPEIRICTEHSSKLIHREKHPWCENHLWCEKHPWSTELAIAIACGEFEWMSKKLQKYERIYSLHWIRIAVYVIVSNRREFLETDLNTMIEMTATRHNTYLSKLINGPLHKLGNHHTHLRETRV